MICYPTEHFFSIKELDVSSSKDIQVLDVSADLYFGRRFQVMCIEKFTGELTVSKPVKFSQIFKKVKKISKNENDIERLKEIDRFLGDLRSVEQDAKSSFAHRGCFYKLLTRFQRIFSKGSHLKRIDALKEIIKNKIKSVEPNAYYFVEKQAVINRVLDYSEVLPMLLPFIDECIEAGELNRAFELSVRLFGKKENEILVKIGNAALESNDLIMAFRIVRKLHPQVEGRKNIYNKISHALLENPDLYPNFPQEEFHALFIDNT